MEDRSGQGEEDGGVSKTEIEVGSSDEALGPQNEESKIKDERRRSSSLDLRSSIFNLCPAAWVPGSYGRQLAALLVGW